jgi:hypothetical protein
LILKNKIDEFCKTNSLIACGLIDTFSKGEINIISNLKNIDEFIDEFKGIFSNYRMKNIEFSLSENFASLGFPKKIIILNDNI